MKHKFLFVISLSILLIFIGNRIFYSFNTQNRNELNTQFGSDTTERRYDSRYDDNEKLDVQISTTVKTDQSLHKSNDISLSQIVLCREELSTIQAELILIEDRFTSVIKSLSDPYERDAFLILLVSNNVLTLSDGYRIVNQLKSSILQQQYKIVNVDTESPSEIEELLSSVELANLPTTLLDKNSAFVVNDYELEKILRSESLLVRNGDSLRVYDNSFLLATLIANKKVDPALIINIDPINLLPLIATGLRMGIEEQTLISLLKNQTFSTYDFLNYHGNVDNLLDIAVMNEAYALASFILTNNNDIRRQSLFETDSLTSLFIRYYTSKNQVEKAIVLRRMQFLSSNGFSVQIFKDLNNESFYVSSRDNNRLKIEKAELIAIKDQGIQFKEIDLENYSHANIEILSNREVLITEIDYLKALMKRSTDTHTRCEQLSSDYINQFPEVTQPTTIVNTFNFETESFKDLYSRVSRNNPFLLHSLYNTVTFRMEAVDQPFVVKVLDLILQGDEADFSSMTRELNPAEISAVMSNLCKKNEIKKILINPDIFRNISVSSIALNDCLTKDKQLIEEFLSISENTPSPVYFYISVFNYHKALEVLNTTHSINGYHTEADALALFLTRLLAIKRPISEIHKQLLKRLIGEETIKQQHFRIIHRLYIKQPEIYDFLYSIAPEVEYFHNYQPNMFSM